MAAVDSQGRTVRVREQLIAPAEIDRRVRSLAHEITAMYDDGSDVELVLVAIMTGSMVFLADLIRAMPVPLRIGIMIVSSYGGTATTAGPLRTEYDLQDDIADKHVLIVDDILDTGQTLSAVRESLLARRPKTLRTCVLLRKTRANSSQRPEADFVGFDIPDAFVVGYGLDYDHLFRNHPGIVVLERT
jgi:hypoxanthine phosphoribosyltransferase